MTPSIGLQYSIFISCLQPLCEFIVYYWDPVLRSRTLTWRNLSVIYSFQLTSSGYNAISEHLCPRNKVLVHFLDEFLEYGKAMHDCQDSDFPKGFGLARYQTETGMLPSFKLSLSRWEYVSPLANYQGIYRRSTR